MPAQYPKIKAASLPDDVRVLLLIATGNEEEIKKAVESAHRPKETIKKAAIFFIENILLSPDADHYRILGVNPDANSHELRRNMALMIRYLHPDISHNKDTTLVTRDTKAWDDLKTADKRAAYDAQRRQNIRRDNRKHNLKTSSQTSRKKGLDQKKPLPSKKTFWI